MKKVNSSLKRNVGLFGVVAIAAGSVIGAGPMVLAQGASELSGPAVWLAYLIIGLPLIIVAISYAAVGSAMPMEGGTYYYPTRVYSPFVGFLSGWTRWLAYITPVAITAIAFSDHIRPIIPGISEPVLMVGFIVIFYILNIFGIKISSITQSVLFVILVLGLLSFGLKGLTTINPEYMTPMQPFGFGGTIRAAALVFFAYVGFTCAAEIGDEVIDPGRNVPSGMVIAIILCVGIYVLMSISASGNLLWSEQAATNTPIYAAAKIVFPRWGSFLFLFIVLMALSTSQNAFQIASSRMALTLAKDRAIPEGFGVLNPHYGTPIWALTATVVVALIFVFSGRGLVFAAYTSNISFLFGYVAVMISTILLPRNKPELYAKAPFKLKGIWNYILPIIAILVSIIFILLQEPLAMLWTGVWIAVGAIIYFIRKKQLAKEGIKLEELMKYMAKEKAKDSE